MSTPAPIIVKRVIKKGGGHHGGSWKVAFADGNLDQHEQHLIKRIADLLYVRHSDVITSKQRARSAVLGA